MSQGTQPFGLSLGATTSSSQPPQPTQPAQPFGLGFGATTSSSQPAQVAQPVQQPQQNTQNNQQATGGSSQSAYFDHLLERARKNNKNNGVSQFGELPNLQLGLADIARKVRDLGTGGPAEAGAPGTNAYVQYLLAASGVSVASALRDLNDVTARSGTNVAAQAANEPDADIDAYVAGLHAQTTSDLITQSLEQSKRDFDAFLEENVQMEWDAQRRRIYEHFGLVGAREEDGSVDASQSGFGRSSRRNRPLAASTSVLDLGQNGMSIRKSVIGNAGKRTLRGSALGDLPKENSGNNLASIGGDASAHFQRNKQEKYGQKVSELNQARIGELTYPLLTQFCEVEAQSNVDDTSYLVDSYKSLIEGTEESAVQTSLDQPGAIRERKFARLYLSDDAQRSMDIRKRILNGSRKSLENKFLAHVDATIERNPKEARLGGIPTILNRVRAYIRVATYQKELGAEVEQLQTLNDDYLWVLIYYLIRCGLVTEAAQYVQDSQRAIVGIDRTFPQVMSAYANDPERTLPPDLALRLRQEWNRQSSYPTEQVDPYRMACYKVIGRIELERRTLPNINMSHEDWIWLQFALARESRPEQELAANVFDLAALRQTVVDIGNRHFKAGADNIESPGTFFHLQMLVGMYEQAVAWLYDFNHVAAIHFAIALEYYGLLRVSDFNQSELLGFSTREEPQINFALMVGHYTGDFRSAKPELAVDYLTLICLNSDLEGALGERQSQICLEALRELVLETREFALLLGDILANGERIQGAIQRRSRLIRIQNEDTFLQFITSQAAAVAEDCGRVTDAVLLYHLAEDYDSVVSVLNKTLCEVISTELGQERIRLIPPKPRVQTPGEAKPELQSSLSLTTVDDPSILADSIRRLYMSSQEFSRRITKSNWEILGRMVMLAKARDLVNQGNWDGALMVTKQTNLLPLSAQGDIAAIRTAANNFNAYPELLARTVGPLLLYTIVACGQERKRLRGSPYFDATKVTRVEELGQDARDLMVFAGLVRYRLEGRVFEALARAGGDAEVA
ncbi:putative nuclear pore protein [Eremomyces bilateralis CBS 781.70]|uniref:Nuclear pore protein n=1 Tax=Eremomyces bilateralis CBS 781.70 TaxID=1392243 RepID=A0A6G1G4V4_9PEZI|nr:putative nuclear pore protein [Eremomyces bilateralis CBS 781.70]KAF1812971.1 putative nuclear pore protein [Eremomyces bilateralis CBS 781.70]